MRSWPSCAATTPILVDSNVILDLATVDSVWAQWSSETLTRLLNQTVLVINSLIYAEISVRYESVEELEAALPMESLRRDVLPYEAAFLAGKCFLEYRRRGGRRTSPLPDFYIGAHAAVCGYRLLTRDATRYRSYFPRVELIAPRAP
jgi:predicted nucleic acid-binding protein